MLNQLSEKINPPAIIATVPLKPLPYTCHCKLKKRVGLFPDLNSRQHHFFVDMQACVSFPENLIVVSLFELSR